MHHTFPAAFGYALPGHGYSVDFDASSGTSPREFLEQRKQFS
jgi:hypothetical protein